MQDQTTPQDSAAMPPALAGSVDHRRQLRVRDWRGGNVDLWIDEDGDFGIMKAEARRSLVIDGSDIQKIAAWLGGTSLTDAERTLLVRLACGADHPRAWTNRALTADDRATLRGLLERLK